MQIDASSVLTLSTGIIGVGMPMIDLENGVIQCIERIENTEEAFLAAAQAILTTDQSRKTASRKFEIEGVPFSICGCAKGAGMIGPKMATMLSIITTDFPISPEIADRVLRSCVNQSFNCVSVEGHTSTNDAVLLMSSSIHDFGVTDAQIEVFEQYVLEVCVELAKMIPSDGEGATHLIEINVNGADSNEDADIIARQIAQSNLVKTAIAGGDPNWGRIVSAAGNSPDVVVSIGDSTLKINGFTLFMNGEPVDINESQVSDSIKNNFLTKIDLSFGAHGAGDSTHWTSDLTQKYVQFNSEYST